MISFSLKDTLIKLDKERANPKPKKPPKIKLKVIAKSSPSSINVEGTAPMPLLTNDKGNESLISQLSLERSALLRQRAKLSSGIYKAVYGRTSDISIDIRDVLNKLDVLIDENEATPRTFGIRCLTAKSKSELINCKKYLSTNRNPERKVKHNLKESGIIMLTAEAKPLRSVLVNAIYEFKDYKSNRWLRVQH